nr:MAG TPA: hypothetical protein [Caudoviricetes sp.]
MRLFYLLCWFSVIFLALNVDEIAISCETLFINYCIFMQHFVYLHNKFANI